MTIENPDPKTPRPREPEAPPDDTTRERRRALWEEYEIRGGRGSLTILEMVNAHVAAERELIAAGLERWGACEGDASILRGMARAIRAGIPQKIARGEYDEHPTAKFADFLRRTEQDNGGAREAERSVPNREGAGSSPAAVASPYAHFDGFAYSFWRPPYCPHCLCGPPSMRDQLRAIVREEIERAFPNRQ